MFSAQDLLQAAEESSSHRLASSTTKAYKDAYCQYITILPLIKDAPSPEPVSEEKIILFLAYKFKMGVSYNIIITLKRCLCAYCLNEGKGNFSNSEKILNYLKGLKREMLGSRCPYAVEGFTREMLCSINEKCNKSNFQDLRDICAFTLCFEGILRASELLNLKIQDLEISEEKVKIFICRSKTDQFGEGRFIYIFKHEEAPISAYLLLQNYLKYRQENQINGEFLFTKKNGERLNDRSYRQRIKFWVNVIGEDPFGFSTHSFRVGAVETLTKKKIPAAAIKQQGGWRSNCFLRYARISEEEASELVQEAFQ